MAKFVLDEVRLELIGDHYSPLRCTCNRFYTVHPEEMRKHLAKQTKRCRKMRTALFWKRKRGFVPTHLTSRFPELCHDIGIEVWRDFLRMEAPFSRHPRMEAGLVPEEKYGTWIESWALSMWHHYHGGKSAKTNVARRKLDSPNDGLMRAVLSEAKTDLEFRGVVRGLQRMRTPAAGQRDAFYELLQAREIDPWDPAQEAAQ